MHGALRSILLAVTATTVALAAPATASVPPTAQCDGKTATVLVSTAQGPAWISPGVSVGFTGASVEFLGTGGDDVIVATNGPDSVDGDSGADTVCTRKGADTAFGSSGNDYLAL